MKLNLVHKLGLVAGQGQDPYLTWALDAGCRLFRSDPSWPLCQPKEDQFEFDWFKVMRDKVYARGGRITAGLFAMPWWADPSQPKIPRWTFDAIATWKTEFMLASWQTYVTKWCQEFPDIETVSFSLETNVLSTWRNLPEVIEIDPKMARRPRSAIDYTELVVKPVMPILKHFNKKVILGAPSLRGQNWDDFREALLHFRDIRNANDTSIGADFLDIHVYHDKGAAGVNVVNDIKRFFMHYDSLNKPIKNPIYISETGFNEGSCFTPFENFWRKLFGKQYPPEDRQARNYKELLSFVEQDERDWQERKTTHPLIKQLYCYEMFDPPERTSDKNGLLQLNPDGTVRPKPAALLLKEYWQAA